MFVFRLCATAYISFVLGFCGCTGKKRQSKVLLFSKAVSFKHQSIPIAQKNLKNYFEEQGFLTDTTSDARYFSEDRLKEYDAIVFLLTTGDVLNEYQQLVFQRYIQAGGGFLGIHSASDTEHNWPWFGKLVGNYFANHPEIQDVHVQVVQEDESTRHMPKPWLHKDEWYNFKADTFDKNIQFLLKVDEKTYKGGTMGAFHPISWKQEFDGGKSFYTALGHTNECYDDPNFLKHILGGLRFVTENADLDYSKCANPLPPDDTRFTQTYLAENLNEPMELAVAPDGRVFVVERLGTLKMYNPATQTMSEVGRLQVWMKYEDGLLGITLDPDFKNNGWMYLFYSPDIEESIQRVSRFTFRGDSLDKSTEKILFTIPTQREQCCHSGGSLTFDDSGNLWISVGDNTNPFASLGFNPVDERPGRSAWDAQKSSASTNDLRGKILRIKPLADGTYTIPEGNLFPVGTEGTRPEIYVMGCRNPYRIAVDSKRNFVYWGDVGPDSGKDSTFGSKGYDEINVAVKPGFFGWPYFIGNNFPYTKFDFKDSILGPKIQVSNWKNTSPNNTGLQQPDLVPNPALLWYPYKRSTEFPMLDEGGRCAMGGLALYAQDFPGSLVKIPAFYDRHFLAYDWMRGWIFAVLVDDNGKLIRMNRMMNHVVFSKLTDLAFGSKGEIYALEYGENWFAPNKDARLSKIEYLRSNRPPIAKATANVMYGSLPFTVQFSAEGSSDPDFGDSLTYEWRAFSPGEVNATSKNSSFTFTKPGVYPVILVATDNHGSASTAQINVYAGNTPSTLSFEFSGNQTFYLPGKPLLYTAKVKDEEDEKTPFGLNMANLKVSMERVYGVAQKSAKATLGHQTVEEHTGLVAIRTSDCKACHQLEEKSVGPSYRQISERYKGVKGAADQLAKKIIAGGGGNWGDHAMSSHPQLSYDVTSQMVSYILSLPAKDQITQLPHQGKIELKQALEPKQTLKLEAIYTDRGAKGLIPITSSKEHYLKSPKMEAEDEVVCQKATRKRVKDKSNNEYLQFQSPSGIAYYPAIDFTGLKGVRINYANEMDGIVLEMRLDSLQGTLLSSINCKNTENWNTWKTSDVAKIQAVGLQKLYLSVKRNSTNPLEKKVVLNIDYIEFL